MRAALLALLALSSGCAEAPAPAAEQPPPLARAAVEDAVPAAEVAGDIRVAFSTPEDGATVTSPVRVGFLVTGLDVRPAGDLTENTGHHHLIVDGGPIPAGTPVPSDATHVHFGQGQVEATVELTPGVHTLTMQFADGNHLSFGPELSRTIAVTVAE